MLSFSWRSALHAAFMVWATVLISRGNPCIAADKVKIQEAIRKAQGYVLRQRLGGPYGAIAALGYLKSGGDKNSPAIQEVTQDVLKRFQGGTYLPIQHHTYEASVDMMLLEALDEKLYRPQIEAAVTYLLSIQQPNGSWYYPNNIHRIEPECGDTSITQYAVMGLWAAARVDVEIPVEVWEKIARWHIASQRDDGGFCYHPFDSEFKIDPESKMSVGTMTIAGSSSLLIIRRILFGDASQDPEIRPSDTKRRFGVLERFVEEKGMVKREVTLRQAAIDNALKGSVRWMIAHYGEKTHRSQRWFTYKLYSMERVGALMDVVDLGDHDWYDDGADELLTRQSSDGSWTDECTSLASTAMGLMFLSKATTTIVKPKLKVNLMGGGLQAGGRGLPDNLDAVQIKDGAVSSRKMVGAVDNLLIELERSSDAKVQDVQAAVVDTVQLDRPEDLIGQVERLRKLAEDSRAEVRRTALWALGRSGDVSAAPSLIRGLSDADLSIVREASLALCILSRRPEGCGKTVDPTDDSQLGIKDGTSDEERKSILEAWQKESTKRWLDWYQRNRSYEARDDRTTLTRSGK